MSDNNIVIGICPVCDKAIYDNEKSLQCISCEETVHEDCSILCDSCVNSVCLDCIIKENGQQFCSEDCAENFDS